MTDDVMKEEVIERECKIIESIKHESYHVLTFEPITTTLARQSAACEDDLAKQ